MGDHLHPWNLSLAEARTLQAELAGRIRLEPLDLAQLQTIAAADVSFDRGSPELFAAVVVVDAKTFALREAAGVQMRGTFPYVPGFLSFREAPALLAAFAKLTVPFDAVICDGQGIAHPRRLGIASHLGLWLDRPTVGSGKSRLFGTFVEPGPARGDRSELRDGAEQIGTVFRTRARSGPLFISPGHHCDHASAVGLIEACLDGRRLPVPQRMAHDEVNRLRRAAGRAAEPADPLPEPETTP